MASLVTRPPRLKIPLFPSKYIESSSGSALGSAHVSVELESGDEPVLIEADCTSPPWQEQLMTCCGQQPSGKYLFTMLYEDVPVGPVKFRMWTGEALHHDHDFYERGRRCP